MLQQPLLGRLPKRHIPQAELPLVNADEILSERNDVAGTFAQRQ